MRFSLRHSAVLASTTAILWAHSALAVDGTWFQHTPISRYASGAVYDPIRQRMIVLGGSAIEPTNDVRALALSGPLTWSRLDGPSSLLPSGMSDLIAAFDADSDRIIAYHASGGGSPSVIAFRNTTPTTWYAPTVTGSPPPSRSSLSWTFDPVGKRILIFGGYDGTNYFSDVWALNFGPTLTWQQLSPSGPPPGRYGAALAFDAARNRLVMFGGYGKKLDPFAPPGALADAWTLSFTPTLQWTSLAPAGTPPTAGTAKGLFDGPRDRMLLFLDGSTDVAALGFGSSTTWSTLANVPGPNGDYAFRHALVLDPVGNQVVAFGGNPTPAVANTWILNLVSGGWSSYRFGVEAPATRSPALAFDSPRDRMLLLRPGTPVELWEFAPGTAQWTALGASGAPTFVLMYACYDPYADRLVVCGQTSGSTMEVWTVSLTPPYTWSPVTVGGVAHPPLNTTFTYDPLRNRLISFQFSLGVWVLDLASPEWVNLATTGAPPAVSGATYRGMLDPVHDAYLVMGGNPYFGGAGNGTWSLNLATLSWSTLIAPSPGVVPYEVGQSGLFDPAGLRAVAFGGAVSANGNTNQTVALDLVAPPLWTYLSPLGTRPDARRSHAIVLDPIRDQLLLFGGVGNFDAPYYAGPWALIWGAGGPPSLACGGGEAARAGTTVPLDYPLTNPYGFGQTVTWELRSQRPWPGYPLSGTASVAANATGNVHVDAPVPDTAAGASNRLTFRAVFRQSPFPVTCARDLYVGLDVPPPAHLELALARAGGEPGRDLVFDVTLPDGAASRLEVFDVSGRRVFQRRLEALGAGRHRVKAGDASIRPGVYLARLTGVVGTCRLRAVVIE